MDDTLRILKQMGLTEYESKAYLAMVSLIYAKADQISKQSEVPRSKIYMVLESLSEKGFIEVISGRPLYYRIIPPEDAFTKYKTKLLRDLDEIQERITSLYDSKLPSNYTSVTTLDNQNKIIQKQDMLLDKSTNTLYIRIGFILPEQVENIKKLLKKVVAKNVTVKILAVPKCTVDNQEIDVKSILNNLPVDVKYMNLPAIQLIIRDYKEMLMVFTENSGKSVSNKNMVGLLNTNPIIISNFILAFNKHWKKEFD